MRPALPVLFVTALLASASAAADDPPVATDTEATLMFVAPYSDLVGNSFGMDYVDAQGLVLDQRRATTVPGGLRTIWYSCPGEAAPEHGSRMSFDFEPGKTYELVCRSGQQATIRESEMC